jgi:hypothetical protein
MDTKKKQKVKVKQGVKMKTEIETITKEYSKHFGLDENKVQQARNIAKVILKEYHKRLGEMMSEEVVKLGRPRQLYVGH